MFVFLFLNSKVDNQLLQQGSRAPIKEAEIDSSRHFDTAQDEEKNIRIHSLNRQVDTLQEEINALRIQNSNLIQIAAKAEHEVQILTTQMQQLQQQLQQQQQSSQNLHQEQKQPSEQINSSSTRRSITSLALKTSLPPNRLISSFRLHDKGSVNQLAFRICLHKVPPSVLLSAGDDGKVCLLDCSNLESCIPNQPFPILKQFGLPTGGGVTALDVSEDFNRIVCASSGKSSLDTIMSVFTLSTQRCGGSFRGHAARIVHCSFIEHGRIVSAALDRTIRVWDARREVCLKTLHTPSNIYSAEVSKDRAFLATGHQNGSVKVYSLRGASSDNIQEVCSIERAHSMPITGVCFSDIDSNIIATVGRDNLVKLFDLRRIEMAGSASLVSFDCSDFRVRDAYSLPSLNTSQGFLAAPSTKGFAVWSTKTGALLCQPAVSGGATAVTWINGESDMCAVGNGSGDVSLWGTGEEVED